MCVIVYKPKNVKISENTIQDMWLSNPDGAGFVVFQKGKLTVSKGYLDIESFKYDLEHVKDYSLGIHFRYATHGAVTNEMTHPFIISKDIKEASETFIDTDKPVLLHNGIITGFGNDKISDTADYVTNVLAHMPSIQVMKKLLHTTGSKYLLAHNGKIHFIGKFEQYKGLQVSNTYWDSSRMFADYPSHSTQSRFNFNFKSTKGYLCD